MDPLRKSALTDRPQNFSRYLDLAPDVDLHDLLRAHADPLAGIDPAVYVPRENHAYAVGKWTVAGVIQHMVDTERIFTYRALRFARRDAAALPGFDENAHAAQAPARGFTELASEFRLVRASTIALYAGFDAAGLRFVGNANGTAISAGSFGFAIIGHQLHHCAVLAQRYRA